MDERIPLFVAGLLAILTVLVVVEVFLCELPVLLYSGLGIAWGWYAGSRA